MKKTIFNLVLLVMILFVANTGLVYATRLPSGFVAVTDPTWVVDRFEPESFAKSANYLGMNNVYLQSVKPPSQADTFYNYQGMSKILNTTDDSWILTTSVYLDSDMISGAEPRQIGAWLSIKGESGDVVGYPLIDFKNYDAGAKTGDKAGESGHGWYNFDDETGAWSLINVTPTVGWHQIKFEAREGVVKFYIDNVLVKTKDYGEIVKVANFIPKTYNFNNTYSLYFTEPTYTALARDDVFGITVNKSTLSLMVKTHETLTATVDKGPDATNTPVFASSNTAVATVDQTGLVTAVSKGSATITATIENKVGHAYVASCLVTVVPDPTINEVLFTVANANNTNITIPSSNITDLVGDTSKSSVQISLRLPAISSVNIQGINVDNEVFSNAKENSKDLVFNIKNSENKLLYSWTFKGSEINKTDIDVNLSLNVLKVDDVQEVKNIVKNQNSLVLAFNHSGNLPSTALVKVYVGDQGYKVGDTVYLYFYNSTKKTVEYKGQGYTVDSNLYVEVPIDHCSSYVLTKSPLSSTTDNPETGDINLIILVVIGILGIAGTAYSVKKLSRTEK